MSRGMGRQWLETWPQREMGAGGESASKGWLLPKASSASLSASPILDALEPAPLRVALPAPPLPRWLARIRAAGLGPALPPRCRRMRSQLPSLTRLGNRLQGILWCFLRSGFPKGETSRVLAAELDPAPRLRHNSCRLPANYGPLVCQLECIIVTIRTPPTRASTDYARACQNAHASAVA